MSNEGGTSTIKVGDLLNGIYRVERFLARGGMGEVFVGSNIQTDEKVALKVILPALAADPKIQEMFRKEAKTLTKLSHPALVQYRVLAEEPNLGVLYIATDFIEGKSLSEVITGYGATLSEITALTRRLADGLRAAHDLGAIHRDMSPDNVLLERGRLERARIIDFGIAKDLDPGSKTIIGDGFAGKLGFVAPEQMGDFNREIGPWTDVYSLGLIILAVAKGRPVDMGQTIVEAIDKRRNPPDLSEAPAELRPLLQAMLVPDPTVRLRTMSEVIEVLDRGNYQRTMIASPITMLDLIGEANAAGEAAPAALPAASPPPPAKTGQQEKPVSGGGSSAGGSKLPLIGGVAAAIALAAGGYYFLGSGGGTGDPLVDSQTAAAATDCSWLRVEREATANKLVVRGGAGDVEGVNNALARVAGALTVDTSSVAPLEPTACGLLDSLKPLASSGVSLTPNQTQYELRRGAVAGKTGPSAAAAIEADIGTGDNRFVLYDLNPSGKIDRIFDSTKLADFVRAGSVEQVSDDRFRLKADIDETGWRGLVLLSGTSELPDAANDVLKDIPASDALQAFADQAQKSGWKVDVTWINFKDENSD